RDAEHQARAGPGAGEDQSRAGDRRAGGPGRAARWRGRLRARRRAGRHAVGGPRVPTPSWKLVVEVLDPARLQHTVQQAVARCNDELRQNGKPEIQLAEERDSGRTWYTIRGNGDTPEVHYVYEDGYLVAAPSRALVERALQQR